MNVSQQDFLHCMQIQIHTLIEWTCVFMLDEIFGFDCTFNFTFLNICNFCQQLSEMFTVI